MKNNRFKKIYKQHIDGVVLKIIVDENTGVHYIVSGGFSPSITPLLNEDGSVVVKKI